MNIYSIEEIIKASNSILKKKDTPVYKNIELNKIKKIDNKKKPLLIPNKDSIKRVPVIIHNVNNDELLDKLYNFFKNKVKKNTIKLIIELKEELVSLGNKIVVLKFHGEEKDKSNILLKSDILNLVNEKNKIKYELKKEIINTNLLQVENKNLKSKYLDLESNLKTLKNEKYELKKEIINTNLLQVENKNLKSKYLDLESNLKTLKNEKYELKKEIINTNLLQVENKNLKSKYLDLESNLKTLKNEKYELKKETDELQVLTNTLKLPKNLIEEKNKQIVNLKNKIIFYQEDSLRINNELMNSQKKLKNINLEISNLKNERINFIEKVNSINKVIKGENVVSNAFEDSIASQIDYNKNKEKINKNNLNNEIKKIFDK